MRNAAITDQPRLVLCHGVVINGSLMLVAKDPAKDGIGACQTQESLTVSSQLLRVMGFLRMRRYRLMMSQKDV
jgi:hypothetical protein